MNTSTVIFGPCIIMEVVWRSVEENEGYIATEGYVFNTFNNVVYILKEALFINSPLSETAHCFIVP